MAMNTILIMSDTFRRDNLSCYGPTPVRTPRLDAFASQAYVFDNAYMGSFPTIPNRRDIMTGQFVCRNSDWEPLPADAITLQQILTASDINTMMIVDNPHLVEMGYNYNRGFAGWEWIRGQETDNFRTAPKHIALPCAPHKLRTPWVLLNHLRNTRHWQAEEDRFAPRTIQAACRWLEENQNEGQFFLYLDLFDPHEPWDPPQHYIDLYDPDYDGEQIIYPNYGFWRNFLTERELQHICALYRAEASMVDHWIGVLLDKLDALGLTEDTAVIFSSDHGYLFGEHDLTGKSLFPERNGRATFEAVWLYDAIRRIPLLIRLPGQTKGSHISALVQSPDLFPTILEMAGLVATETIAGHSQIQVLQCGVFQQQNWQFRPESIHGRSLMPLLRGEIGRLRDIAVSSHTLMFPTGVLAKAAIVTEDGWCLHYAGSYDEPVVGGKLFNLELADAKNSLLGTNPAPMLFNLTVDPGETTDVLDSNEGLAREIHDRYVGWLEETGTPAAYIAGRRRLR